MHTHRLTFALAILLPLTPLCQVSAHYLDASSLGRGEVPQENRFSSFSNDLPRLPFSSPLYAEEPRARLGLSPLPPCFASSPRAWTTLHDHSDDDDDDQIDHPFLYGIQTFLSSLQDPSCATPNITHAIMPPLELPFMMEMDNQELQDTAVSVKPEKKLDKEKDNNLAVLKKKKKKVPKTKSKGIKKEKKRYCCDKCGQKYKYKRSFKAHCEEGCKHKTVAKHFQCTSCPKRFHYKLGLINHMRTHTGERPFKCQECDQRFKQKNNLTQHMRIHTGEKPYKCQKCDRVFAQKSNLNVHERSCKKQQK